MGFWGNGVDVYFVFDALHFFLFLENAVEFLYMMGVIT